MAAAAAADEWQPQEQGLREICLLLQQQITPGSDQVLIWNQLQHLSRLPDFNNYLVFILAQAPLQAPLEVRQAAGLLLKNHLRSTFAALPPHHQRFVKAQPLPCLGSPDRAVRSTVGTVVSVLFQLVRVAGWPELLQALLHCLE